MRLIDTKTVDSTANVINKIESTNIDPPLTNILLLIIFIILFGYIFYKAYLLHNKCISKSQANDQVRSNYIYAQTIMIIIIKIYIQNF